jgi:hypothetical protein
MPKIILTIVRLPCGLSMSNLVTNKECAMHQSTEHDICLLTHIGKLDQLCISTMVTCPPCLMLHHSLHQNNLITACQGPLDSLCQPFNVQRSRLLCRRRATISQITFGPTYNNLFGVPGSMPSLSNKPGVLAAVMAWLTCAGVAFGFWARKMAAAPAT